MGNLRYNLKAFKARLGGSEQPGLVVGNPAHSTRVEMR